MLPVCGNKRVHWPSLHPRGNIKVEKGRHDTVYKWSPSQFSLKFFLWLFSLVMHISYLFPADENFAKASQVLITWLERGECNRRTSTGFYSMIQNVHSHVRRLNSEKAIVRDEFEQYKIQYQQRLQGIGGQCKYSST